MKSRALQPGGDDSSLLPDESSLDGEEAGDK